MVRLALGVLACLVIAPGADAAGLKAVTYTTDNPTVLSGSDTAQLAVRVSPDKDLYRISEPPRVTVESEAMPGARLVVRVQDGFGQVLAENSRDAERGGSAEVALPPGHGYYEVIAALQKGGATMAEARHSIGVLSPPPNPVGDEPFGLWTQGRPTYPELGVRWTREGIWYPQYKEQGQGYLDKRRELFDLYRAQHIKVIAYPKHPHPHQTSREVIEDTPEAWRDLETWWTTMVRFLAGHVDAWAVINEPLRGSWKGSDELIVRYWALMRKIVDRYDPETPLLGPSLNPNTPALVEQYRHLLDLGFGKLIDGIEMHTYIDNPERGWVENDARVREMTKRATGRDLKVWSTEHGLGAQYKEELRQAQHLMRSWLEAKRIGMPVMIWHMFSNPQGTNARERSYAIFRNSQRGGAQPQPRPSGVAYGVMTRQLAGARFVRVREDMGAGVRAYEFQRGGKTVVAVWTDDKKPHEVALPASRASTLTVTGLFGRVETLNTGGGARLTADGSPKFVAF